MPYFRPDDWRNYQVVAEEESNSKPFWQSDWWRQWIYGGSESFAWNQFAQTRDLGQNPFLSLSGIYPQRDESVYNRILDIGKLVSMGALPSSAARLPGLRRTKISTIPKKGKIIPTEAVKPSVVEEPLVKEAVPAVTPAPEVTTESIKLLPSGEKTIPGVVTPTAKEFLSPEVRELVGDARLSDFKAETKVMVEMLKGRKSPGEIAQYQLSKAILKELEKVPSEVDFVTYLEPEYMATNAQKTQIHEIARQRRLLGVEGETTPKYRAWLKRLTGKNSTTQMTEAEAQKVINSILPKTRAIITKDLADKIPYLKETGLFDRWRQMPKLLEKIGLYEDLWKPLQLAEIERAEALFSFRRGLLNLRNLNRSVASKERIFNALEGELKPELLNPQELQAYDWLKGNFDKWADTLNLPQSKRITKYVTHLFEETVTQELKAKRFDAEMFRAMDFQSPKSVFNPFLQERLGKTAGLLRDPFLSADVYEQYALRQLYYDPLVKKLAVFQKILFEQNKPIAANHLKALANRLVNRPDNTDREMNQSIREFVTSLNKFRKIPVIGDRLQEIVNRGNFAGALAHGYSSFLYSIWLGLRPVAALRNLTQQFLAVSEAGPGNFANGVALRLTQEGKDALSKSVMLRQRQVAFLPGIDQSMISGATGKTQEIMLWMFRVSDRENIKNSFLSGYQWGKSLGLPKEWAVRLGDEVSADTQFIYTRMARGLAEDTAYGRFLTPFTSFPRNFMELLGKWVSGVTPRTVEEYMKATGNIVKLPHNAVAKRKALLTFLGLVIMGYVAENNSNIKISEYTGWTSLKTVADMLTGSFPALDMIGGFAEMAIGASTLDERMMKRGFNKVRPDKMVSIIRQFEDIIEGKRDWLSLLLYMKPTQTAKEGGYKLPSGWGEGTPSGGAEYELPSKWR